MRKQLIIIVSLIILPIALKAQFIEDALRYSKPNGTISPRVAALGVSYIGLADDYGALFYNPAGLTLVQKSELNIGLGFKRNTSETNFLSQANLFNSNSEYITNLGIVSGFVKDGKKISVGIGYFRESDFYNTLEFSAMNPNSSIIASETKFGPNVDADNWAYELYLSNKSNSSGYSTPYTDSLVQTSFINESGGLHNLSGGIAFDINENISMGAALIGKWGTYGYKRDYKESDGLGVYSNTSIDGYSLSELRLKEDISQRVSGISGSLGIIVKYADFLRASANIKFPTWYRIEESFTKRLDASYRAQNSRFFEYKGENSYNLTSPFIYSAGVSFNYSGITFSTGVEYSDVSQLKFSDASSQLLDLNDQIVKELIGQTTWGFGLEYEPGIIPFVGRISFSQTSSPYSFDVANAYKTVLGLGLGAYVSEGVRLDAVFQWQEFGELRTNYTDANYISEYTRYFLNNKPLIISFGITYRY
ncbi:MAG TPA: hypothetical protein PLE30_03805 [Candidatus Kapabacteria bacterium]|nr:hypothetical protein [Candidatus Kapabacteria bacterium]